jgi:hypothetical protein
MLDSKMVVFMLDSKMVVFMLGSKMFVFMLDSKVVVKFHGASELVNGCCFQQQTSLIDSETCGFYW